jgi:UDP-N-acetylmuramoyl-L-alanyl-D-glutamate--2,6-diaminopimelate ligase
MPLLSQLLPSAPIVEDPEITMITADSRTVRPGGLFVAIPGTAIDGRDFIPNAIEKGAAAILSTKGLPDMPVSYIGVDEPRLAYAKAAAVFHAGQPSTLVAMTGTNGKSSTVEFLRQIWVYAGLPAACFGTLGVQSPAGYTPLTHTTPDAMALHETLSGLKAAGVTHAAMEASSHGLKQYRLDAVKIAAAGFSNLTQDHFDYHPDVEDYFSAKARLFTALTPAHAPVVINVNDKYGQKLAHLCTARGQKVMRVGWSGEDIRIDELMPRRASQMMTLIVRGTRYQVELPLAGEFQALNAVAALGLALVTGVGQDTAVIALEHLYGVAGRMERAGQTPQGAPIFVDFAHTEDGLDKLLRSVRPHTMGKIVIVFGCGGDRDPDKRAKMGRIAAALADEVIVTDDNPRTEDAAHIRAMVMEGCPKATEIGSRAAAIREGIARLGSDDCLVVAGKGHEQGQIVGDQIIPFSDVDQVQIALKKRGQSEVSHG